jgi:hypothetical protein
MNYAQLVAAIQSYPENFEQSFVDNIPNFVRQAEQRIFQMVQPPVLRKNVTANMTAGNKYLAVPPGFLAVYSLSVIMPDGSQSFLTNKDVNFIREAFPQPANTGAPTHYALFDQDTFILGPAPDIDYGTELHCFVYPPSIVDAGTSWLGDNFEAALLYGALVEAGAFMKEEADVVAMYQKGFESAMAQLADLTDGKERRDAYRSGQRRITVPRGVVQ